MAAQQRQPGSTLGGYTIVRALAAGGMGAVYVARDPSGREVALKLILQGGGRQRRQRFEVEAQAVARLRHPGIVTVHDYGRDEGGQEYLVMSLIAGATLAQRIAEQGQLAPRTVAQLGRELADALACAHEQGVLHRDLKPANVLVDESGRAVLTDFGLAKVVDQSQHLTQTGELLGTPAYMPPEQIQGKKEQIGPASDIYGLGGTLYAALTGHPPHEADSPFQLLAMAMHDAPIPPNADPRLDRIVLHCLRKSPGDRYPSAAALRADLDRYLAGDSVEAQGPQAARRWLLVLGLLTLGAALWQVLPTTVAQPRGREEPAEIFVPKLDWVDEQAARLRAGEHRDAISALVARADITRAEAERLRTLAEDELPRLCRKQPPPLRAILGRLELLGRLQTLHPREAPEHPAADAVLLLTARLEDSAREQLGDMAVVALLEGVGAAGYRPAERAQMSLFQAMRLSTRPTHAEFVARSHRYLLALIRFDAYISSSNYAQALRLRGPWQPPEPRDADEHYLALRLALASPLLPARLKDRGLQEFLSGPHYPKLSLRNRAYTQLARAAAVSDDARLEHLREAIRLAPGLRRAQRDIARAQLLRIKARLRVGESQEALALLPEACAHADASLRSGSYASYGDEEDALEVAVELHALAGQPERAAEVVASVSATALRNKLETLRQRGLLFRTSFGLERASLEPQAR